MKILTLKQSLITLMRKGLKNDEFRSWKTNYRGKLLIYAGKGIDKKLGLLDYKTVNNCK